MGVDGARDGRGRTGDARPGVPTTGLAPPPVRRQGDDAAAWDVVVRGDHEDFETFARARMPDLLRYATALTGDPHQGADIVQEVLVRASSKWRRIRTSDRPDLYVKRMVTNEHLSWRRRWYTRWVSATGDGMLHARAPAAGDPASSVADRHDVLAPATLEPRVTTDGPVAWALPEACAVGAPATAMLTARDGTGELEARVDVQQVAVFADAASAVAEADRVRQAVQECAAADELVATETVDVGAQGVGVARVYGGEDGGPTPFGTYAVVTRRGAAVALVTVDGGDGSPESSRGPVLVRARQAWEGLCGYDSRGC